MKQTIMAMVVAVLAGMVQAQQYVYVRAGTVQSAPRELPSVGVRLDNGKTVLGLHGSTDAVRAACGWYRVIPAEAPAKGLAVVARSYKVEKTSAREVLTLTNRVVRSVTLEQKLARAWDALPVGMTDDQRCAAVVAAVAQTITGRVSKAVSVEIPAAREVRR